MEVSGSKSLYLKIWIFSRYLTLCSVKPELSALTYSVKMNVIVPIEQEKTNNQPKPNPQNQKPTNFLPPPPQLEKQSAFRHRINVGGTYNGIHMLVIPDFKILQHFVREAEKLYQFKPERNAEAQQSAEKKNLCKSSSQRATGLFPQSETGNFGCQRTRFTSETEKKSLTVHTKSEVSW